MDSAITLCISSRIESPLMAYPYVTAVYLKLAHNLNYATISFDSYSLKSHIIAKVILSPPNLINSAYHHLSKISSLFLHQNLNQFSFEL